MSYLLDADAAIDQLSDAPWASAFVSTLAQTEVAIASTTLVELYTGVYRSSDPTLAEARLHALLARVTLLPLADSVILRAARIRSDLLNRGLSIRTRAFDILAAAFALGHGLTIVTSNTSDYRGIRGLTQLDIRTGQTMTH